MKLLYCFYISQAVLFSKFKFLVSYYLQFLRLSSTPGFESYLKVYLESVTIFKKPCREQLVCCSFE